MNVLYVSADKQDDSLMCPGSIVCIALAEKIPSNRISIQNTDIIRETTSDLPEWLNGTPILINESDGIPHRGKDAIKQMHLIIDSLPDPEISHGNTQIQTQKQMSNTQMSNTQPALSKNVQSMEDNIRSTQPIQSIQENVSNKSPENMLDDHFKIEVSPQIETRSDKVTEQDLQKYMEIRNQSIASVQPAPTSSQQGPN